MNKKASSAGRTAIGEQTSLESDIEQDSVSGEKERAFVKDVPDLDSGGVNFYKH